MAVSLPASAEEEGTEQAHTTVELLYTQISDDPPSEPSDPSAVSSNGYAAVENGHAENGQLQRGGRVITVNGMDFHVFGNLSGLELLEQSGSGSTLPDDSNAPDSDEDEVVQAENAARQAELEGALRRSAPLPSEHCKAIIDAMKGVTLGGFQPDWARAIPEDDWLYRVRNRKDPKGGSLRDILPK